MRALLFASLLFAACATWSSSAARSWTMPLTPEEGTLMAPALTATAEGMGLRVEQTAEHVSMRDAQGNDIAWVSEQGQYRLYVVPVGDTPSEAQYRDLKVRADEIWRLAIEARQQSNVGATVVVTRPTPAASPPPQGYPAPAAAPSTQRSQCTWDSDCGPGFSCSGHRCVSDGSGRLGFGAACTFLSDCGPGMTCHRDYCVSDGSVTAPAGARCDFDSDCGPGMNCDSHRCAPE